MRVGYTTGVFDMFHIGHLNILKQARSICDYLIVGVTVDSEVERIKNKSPIIPFEERIEIVRAIKYVDKAVPEENVDKMIAWNEYQYDVLIKGSDWKGSETYEQLNLILESKGVEVIFFDYTEGVSSTLLREKLQQKK